MNPRATNAHVKTAAGWIFWHGVELTALTLPVVLACTVTGWAWLLAVAVAAGWVAREVRQQHRSRQARRNIPALDTPEPARPLATAEHANTTQEARHG